MYSVSEFLRNRISQRAICLICIFLFSGFAQHNRLAAQSAPSASIPASSTNRNITLDIVVTDKSGKPVPGLEQQDFTLLDNKQPQKILSFEASQDVAGAAEPPIEVVLLVDEVNTAFSNVSYERQQIEKFLGHDSGELPRPMALVFLSDSGTLLRNAPTRDAKALIADLNQNEAGLRTIRRSQGVWGADDRLQLSLRALQQLADYESTKPGRKLVIWISPGWPLLSGPRIDLDSKDQQQLFNEIVGFSDSLRRARITLYSIDPLGTADSGGLRTHYYEDFLKGVKNAKQVQLGDLGLQVFATQSGGRVLISNNDVAGEIAACVADANAFYRLTFEGLVGDGPNEYHSLEVKIDKPRLAARTRSGYYAQPR